jgi:hypothetical protein
MSGIESSSLTIPLSLVLKGTVEAFLPIDSHDADHAPSRPMRMLGPGELFGVFETLSAQFRDPDTTPPWGVTAGARSVTVLTSEMSETMKNKLSHELRQQTIRGAHSTLLSAMRRDGWELVRYLVGGYEATSSPEWMTEVLILTGATARTLRSTYLGALALLNVAESGWVQSHHLRRGMIEEEKLSQNRHLNSRASKIPHEDRIALGGVLRQVLAMARGELPAFAPVTSDSILPVQLFRDRLSKLADTKAGGRAAIVIAPKTLRGPGDSAFVSMKFNCLPAQASKSKRPSADWNAFCDHVEASLATVEDCPLDLAQSGYVPAREAIALLTETAGDLAVDGKKTIPTTLPFLTGCFRLVRNK